MTLEQRIKLLAIAMGGDVKALGGKVGDLNSLGTTAKTSLVAALNELHAAVQNASGINDTTAGTSTSYSSSKTLALIAALKAEILGGVPTAAFDTIKELADYCAADQTAATAMAEALGNRVRFDAVQTLTATERTQACANLGIGNPNTDFVAVYSAAKV